MRLAKPITQVLMLSSGGAAASLISFMAAPILGRLYLPEHYGFLAVYMAFANFLGVASTLQLEHSIIAEQTDRRAFDLVTVCAAIALVVSVIGGVIGVGLAVAFADSAPSAGASFWMLLLPFSALSAGMIAAIRSIANRLGKYGQLSRIPVYTVIVTLSVSIMLGLAGWGVSGLFLSYFLGQLLTVYAYYALYVKLVPGDQSFGMAKSIALLKRHKRFAYFTTPAELLNIVSQQAPVFALNMFGSMAVIGELSRARQIVTLPVTLIGSAASLVFRQHAARIYNQQGECIGIFTQALVLLFALGVPMTLVIWMFGPEIFRVFLGPNWENAGEIASVISPLILLRIMASPLAQVYNFTRNQLLSFNIGIATALIVTISTFSAGIFTGSEMTIIYAFAYSYSAMYLVHIVFSARCALGNRRTVGVRP